MPAYMITYLGGNHPSNPEEGKRHFAKYQAWLQDLGEAAISPANPLKNTRVVKPDGSVSDGSATSMSGFTIIKADSLAAAIEIARACPFLEIGGSLEVSEILEMPSNK
ncbi:MAG: YciI family protein [Candidatus Thiodiazotropha sp. (ex Monitilora ramsayi)]|nr:YciI family protein [Candidatus Thiodiazotropha sp. (ex Monitilora ramsayi)]